MSKLGAYCNVVGKPIPTFPIALPCSEFDIWNGFLTNRQNISNDVITSPEPDLATTVQPQSV